MTNINSMNSENERKLSAVISESFLEKYLGENSTVTDISFNGTELRIQDNVKGRYKPKEQPTLEEVATLGKQIANIQGRQLTPSTPILDTEIGLLRTNFIDQAISPSGTTFAIRISQPSLAMDSIASVSDKDVEKLLEVLMRARQNIVIAGKTGAGKTEIQKRLVGYMKDFDKITLIEDTMDSHIKELYPEKDINSWRTLTEETREHKISTSLLVKAALRNNPDWTIIAESRGVEMDDILESAMTDHSIITTMHVKGAKMIPNRMIRMISKQYPTDQFLLGKDIVESLPFGLYMWSEEREDQEEGEKIRRFIRELVEFTDYTKDGVVYNTLYEVSREYDEKTNSYKDIIKKNKLSDKMLEELKYQKLYHELPDIYKYGEV